MPCHATVFLWDEEDREGFSERMQRARRMAAHFLSEQRLAIADETSRDTLVDEKGYERANNEWIQRSKLRCDVRRDLAAKWNPKRYGERTQFEDITPPAPDDELNKRIAELLQKGKAK